MIQYLFNNITNHNGELIFNQSKNDFKTNIKKLFNSRTIKPFSDTYFISLNNFKHYVKHNRINKKSLTYLKLYHIFKILAPSKQLTLENEFLSQFNDYLFFDPIFQRIKYICREEIANDELFIKFNNKAIQYNIFPTFTDDTILSENLFCNTKLHDFNGHTGNNSLNSFSVKKILYIIIYNHNINVIIDALILAFEISNIYFIQTNI